MNGIKKYQYRFNTFSSSGNNLLEINNVIANLISTIPFPLKYIKIQSAPGTIFNLNGKEFIIGYSGVFISELSITSQIRSLSFNSISIDLINDSNNDFCCIIIDVAPLDAADEDKLKTFFELCNKLYVKN